MAVRSNLLLTELKVLRKGRGVLVAQIGDRVGPALRALSGVAEGASAAELRQKLARRLEELADELPDDLRIAALVSLGLYREAQRPFYQERIRWLADYLQRDERTARRRAEEALDQLAEIAGGAGGGSLEDQPPSTGDLAGMVGSKVSEAEPLTGAGVGVVLGLRRQTADELRAARRASGFTRRYVADAMDWSQSKLARIEAGRSHVSLNDLRALLALYRAGVKVV